MDPTLIAVALIAVVGSSLTPIVAGIVNRRAARRAEEAAKSAQASAAEAQLGILAAQADAAKAQEAAAEAAAELVRTARVTGARLDAIDSTTKTIHTIVNSQRTEMLKVMAALARRVATDNPDDPAAQQAAAQAERDADEAC